MTAPVPVTVLTGYLGAGKTTLLNRILSEDHGLRCAVIVNEFGEIGIDSDLIVGADEELFEMNNGCVCCTVRGDLIRIIGGLLKRKGRFDAILVETTGLADPAPVAQTFFMDAEIAERTRLDAIVTVADAKFLEARLADSPEAKDQLALADIVIVNKQDLVTPEAARALEMRIRAINPYARIVPALRGDVPVRELLGQEAFSLERVLQQQPQFLDDDEVHGHEHHGHEHHGHEHHGHEHDQGHVHEHGPHGGEGARPRRHYHDEEIDSVSLRSAAPLDRARFEAWFQRVLAEDGPRLLRAKGIVAFAGEPRRFVLHAIHMLSEGDFVGAWPAGDPRLSRLVLIGRDLDRAALEAGFRATAAPA